MSKKTDKKANTHGHLIKDALVDEIQQKGNLPIVDAEEGNSDFLEFSELNKNFVKQKTKRDLKKEKEERKKRLKEMQQRLLQDETAAYIQIVKGKKGKRRKIVRYNTDLENGLPSEVVEHRNQQELTNHKPNGSTKTIPAIILSNTFTFFNLLNYAIAAWIISAFGAQSVKYLFFVVIVTTNLVISIVQEIRSKLVIDKLSIMSAATATVLRDGEVYDIAINEVVLDDIVCLSSGKQIPSDAILVEGSIEVNESLLTGESDAIGKKVGDVIYSGSFVVSGNAKARVERVGKDNYIEKLTGQAKKYRKPKSELLGTLKTIITVVAIIIIPLGIVVFVRQWNGLNWGGEFDYIDAVRTTSGAIIGMIPSGLFLLTSVALAVGVIRLAQNKTLVQELYCIEMLARVDCLCLDKTGTITDGSMAVRSVIEYQNDTGLTIKNAISAMQNALNDSNVTSVALEEKFGKGKRIKPKAIIPFSSARKFSAVEFDKFGTYMLGAPEFILTDKFNIVADEVTKAARGGYRVILLAHSNGSIKETKVEGSINPLALILIEDTIRPDAIETIDYFRQSGVEVKVISGDNPLTVSKISERAGIENAHRYISLDGLSDKEVIKAADQYTVFGRVSPSQKKLLVMTLKELGKTVAMTGDGVNDILALKEADCSIALASGSEAARNVSHLVLLDSNFGSMPKVVAEGRRVINNVQKVASLFLTKTIFSFLLAVYCCLIRRYPIATNQLFLIDTFVIGIPSFILILEPNNNKFHGKFIVNVIKNALPGAAVVAFTTALVFFISPILGIESSGTINEVNTIIVLNATFTCFMVLYKVCRPFNVLRKVLYTLMAAAAAIMIIVLPDLFDIVNVFHINISSLPADYPTMSSTGLLLLLVLMFANYPAIRLVENLKPFIKSVINYFVNLIGRIH